MKLDFQRVVRDCQANDRTIDSRSLIYDFDVIVDGERRAVWSRDYGKGYSLRDANDEAVHIRAAREDDYNPDHSLRARAEKKADFAAITEGLLASGRIPSIADCEQRKQGWGRAILERRENARAERLLQAQKEFAGELYAAADGLLISRMARGQVLELFAKIDLRAKEMIDHDAECYARGYVYENEPVEAFTSTLLQRVAS